MADDPIDHEAAEVGIRTFLFADIRGYTRYTGHFGDEAATELTARFGAICSATVSQHGGRVVETRGDEVMAVFASARRALRASVDLQLALRAPTDGGPPLPLGVGIGLDAGEAIPLEEGYRGAALNLAARLCSIAKPGEVLAGDGLARLAGPVQGLRFAPRRPVRLKGVREPVRLVAVEPETPLPRLPPNPLPAEPRKRPRRVNVLISVLAMLLVTAGGLFLALRGSDEAGVISSQGLGVIDATSGEVLDNVALEARPAGVAIGLGAVWLSIPERDTLLKIDIAGRSITDEIQVGSSPAGVAIGDGAVWVVNEDDRTVSRVDPESGQEVASIPVGTGPRDAAFGQGALFVTNTTDGTVSKIDPVQNKVVATIALGQTPSGITTGFGSGWVTSEATGLLIRFDLDDAEVTESIAVGNGPTGVAVGDDAVWVANAPDRTVSLVDPVTASVRKVNVGGAPSSLAFGPDTLWVGRDDQRLPVGDCVGFGIAVVIRQLDRSNGPPETDYFVRLLTDLGYVANPKSPDFELYEKTVGDSRTEAQIIYSGWYADYPAPSTFVEPLLTCDSYVPRNGGANTNYAGFCDASIDSLVAKARRLAMSDPAAARGLWTKIDAALVDRAPLVPLVNPRYIHFLSERVGNFQYQPTAGVVLEQLWVR